MLTVCALWFSPLTFGRAVVYENNEPYAAVEGLCYSKDSVVRVDFCGSVSDLYAALDTMCAKVTEMRDVGGGVVVYAKSPRVAHTVLSTDSGAEYNCMAMYRDGNIAIAAPVLPGWY